jgi:hypothetical protein
LCHSSFLKKSAVAYKELCSRGKKIQRWNIFVVRLSTLLKPRRAAAEDQMVTILRVRFSYNPFVPNERDVNTAFAKQVESLKLSVLVSEGMKGFKFYRELSSKCGQNCFSQ